MTAEEPSPTDDVLVRRVRTGEAHGLAALLHRHEPALRRAVVPLLRNAHDVDDCLQEARLRVIAALPTFREGSPFAPWARTIATNAALSILRRRRRAAGLSPLHDQGEASTAPAPVEALVRSEQAAGVRRAIQALPARCRRVVELRLLHDLGHAEIANLLHLSNGAVRVLFCRGIRNVRYALKGSDAGPF